MRTIILFLFLLISSFSQAQVFELGDEARTVKTGGFWDNWFVQMNLDMSYLLRIIPGKAIRMVV